MEKKMASESVGGVQRSLSGVCFPRQTCVLPQDKRRISTSTFPLALPMMTGEVERTAPCGIIQHEHPASSWQTRAYLNLSAGIAGEDRKRGKCIFHSAGSAVDERGTGKYSVFLIAAVALDKCTVTA